jgi:hypothetical protein
VSLFSLAALLGLGPLFAFFALLLIWVPREPRAQPAQSRPVQHNVLVVPASSSI